MNEKFEYSADYFKGITDTWTKLSFPLISKNLLKSVEGRSIDTALDLGCGFGSYSQILLQHAKTVYGLDISEEACKVCKALGYSEVYNTEIDKMPIASDSLDLVFTSEVLEHVLDYEQMLKEIYRVLGNNGQLVLTTTCYSTSIFVAVIHEQFSWRDYFSYIRGYFNKKSREQFVRKFCFQFLGGHYHGFLPGELLNKIEEIGFVIEEKKLFTVQELMFYKDGKNLMKKVFQKESHWPLYKRLAGFPAAVFFTSINFLINKVFAFKNNILVVARKKR